MISITHNRNQYDGNDSTTVFPYTFEIAASSELLVYLTDGVSDPEVTTLLVLDTDYTVDGVGNDTGGNVTYTGGGTPLPTDWRLTILRDTNQQQLTDFDNQGGYFAESTEDAVDKLTRIVQDHTEILDRTPSADPYYSGTSSTVTVVNSVFGRDGDVTAESGDYDADEIDETASRVFMTPAEQTKLGGVEESADVTDAANVLAAGAVMTTGAQSIGDVKTFTSSPLVPTPTTDFEVCTKGYADAQVGSLPDDPTFSFSTNDGSTKASFEDSDSTEVGYVNSDGEMRMNAYLLGLDTCPAGVNVCFHSTSGPIVVRLSSDDSSAGVLQHQLYNDADKELSIGKLGSAQSVGVLGTGSGAVLNREGQLNIVNDGNDPIVWSTDTTDSQNLSATEKMRLEADGTLKLGDSAGTGAVEMLSLALATGPTVTTIRDSSDTAGSSDTALITEGYFSANSGGGSGDMTKAVYDPTNVADDAFDMDNMVEGTTGKILTATERSNITANTAKVTNATHTGDVTGDEALTIVADAVTYSKMQNVAADDRILGNVSGAGGAVAELTAAQVKTMLSLPVEYGIAVSDETTDLTTGTAKATFRAPVAFTLTGVRASVTTAPTGSVLTVDINEGGTSVLSTKLTIDAGEKTSTTAATPPVISDSAIADDAEITVDIDGIGSTTAGAGLKIWLIGTRG